MTFPVLSANTPSGGYNLTKSLRFRSSASAYMNRTPAGAGNTTTWTWSSWIKRGLISDGNYRAIIEAYTGSSSVYCDIAFNNDQIWVNQDNGAGGVMVVYTNAVFRDPSSWYHLVVAVDTTQATATNRVKIYMNGVQQSLTFSTTPAQNLTTYINSTNPHKIASRWSAVNTTNGFDGYLAEINLVDGQALTPSSFGSTNSTTGVWQPARYTGTYGTNGFYLPFTNTTSTTTLGYDSSGNGNNWTTNNFSLTAGSTYDSMTDVPTLTSATAANYAVVNPLISSNGVMSNGNLTYAGTAAGNKPVTMTGLFKQYGEFTIGAGTQSTFGLAAPNADFTQNIGLSATNYYGVYDNGAGFYLFSNGTTITNIGTQTSVGVVFQIAYDAAGGKLWIGKNNVWFDSSLGTTGNPSAGTNPTLTGIPSNLFMFVGTGNFSTTFNCNFGQQPFAYTPPTGYVALNTYNLPTSTIVAGNKYMDATTYAGTGANQTITNAGAFKPDLVWIKDRTSAFDNQLQDSVRGTGVVLFSNLTDADTASAIKVTAFNSNGFSIGTSTAVNTNTDAYVGWQWQAGQGSTSSNTSGSITSTVSVNATAGFSIVTYTGTAISGTIGHGLGVAPQMIIVKPRSATITTDAWNVYHVSTGNTQFLVLNATDAATTASNRWNNTSPTSSVFSIGTVPSSVGVGYVAYCWAPIAGFSAFGSYTGNGSADGPFIYTGFRPKYVLIKRTDTTGAWNTYDSSRNTYNVVDLRLQPNSTNAEASVVTLDFVSNGFKLRTTDVDRNASGGTYIYACYAENPFKNALAR